MSKKYNQADLPARLYLVGGIALLIWGFSLLADIAFGLLLVFLGFTAVNQRLMKK